MELQTQAALLQNEVLQGYPKDIPSIVVDRNPQSFLNKIALTDFKRAICVSLHENVYTTWDSNLIEYCNII